MAKFHVQYLWETYIDFGLIEAEDEDAAEAIAATRMEKGDHVEPVEGDQRFLTEEANQE